MFAPPEDLLSGFRRAMFGLARHVPMPRIGSCGHFFIVKRICWALDVVQRARGFGI
jgi:hypothetical protein